MKRTQIQLDVEVHRALRLRAYEEGRSVASIIREVLAEKFGAAPSREERLALKDFPFVGMGRSEDGRLSPVSERHDEALAEAMLPRPRR